MWDGRVDLDKKDFYLSTGPFCSRENPVEIKKPRSEEIRGYILSHTGNGWDEWYPCYDLAEILKMDDNSIIWETDREDVITKLECRYPCKTSGLTHIQAGKQIGSRILVYDKEIYLGNDINEAVKFAKKLGRILLGNSDIINAARNLEEKGCICQGFVGYCSELVYNPKTIRTEKKRQENNTKRQPIPAYMLESVTQQMWNMLAREIDLEIAYPLGNRYHTHRNFKSCMTLFNTIFGKNAHRHLDTFQDLKKAWKFRETVTEKAYLKTSYTYKGLIDWMAIEITKSRPKKKELKPKKIFDLYTIFPEEER